MNNPNTSLWTEEHTSIMEPTAVATHSGSRTDPQGPLMPPAGSLPEQKGRRCHRLLLGPAVGTGTGEGRPLPGGQCKLCGALGWHRLVSEKVTAGLADRCVKSQQAFCWEKPAWFSLVNSSFSCLTRAELLFSSSMTTSLSWISWSRSLSFN